MTDIPLNLHHLFEHRLAVEIQNHVVGLAAGEDYHVGIVERDEWAHDYVNHLLDQNAVSPEHLAWSALQVWRHTYGKRIGG